jgi:eukaryotic-like serine/threonine-protein kinase
MPLEPGATVGDYKIIALLGAGGMGQVYKVQNLLSNRIEAMKVLVADLRSQSELAERFLREMQVHASLVHPNLASMHTAMRLDNQLVMLMEFVEGTTLEDRLREGNLAADESMDYARQMLSALAYAHKQGVIHRDIKPGHAGWNHQSDGLRPGRGRGRQAIDASRSL